MWVPAVYGRPHRTAPTNDMEIYLTMPKPGETIREGRVVQWLKSPGDSLEEQESLVELETEKAVFTFESPFRGVLKEILVPEGEQVPVGERLALFQVSEEDGARYKILGVGLPAGEDTSVGVGIRARPKEGQPQGVAPTPIGSSYSPLIRNLAKEHGISPEDLDRIPRSGPRLTKDELLGYIKNVGARLPRPQSDLQEAGGETPPLQSTEYDEIVLSPIRRRIAQKMSESKRQIPHAASSVDVDFTPIWDYAAKHSKDFSKRNGIDPTPFYFFLYAVREVLKKFPLFNSHYVEEGGKAKILQFKSLHLGIAVATPQGLLNPVLHRAEGLSFVELIRAVSELGEKAREGRLTVEELTGATFAVNNPGAFGGARCYQIIPSPRVAIVALNRIFKRPWVVGESVQPRHIAALDLSFDHRVLDGADAIQFLEALKKLLENFPFEVTEM